MIKFKNCGDKHVSFEIHSIPGVQPQKFECAPGDSVEVPNGYAAMIKRRYPDMCEADKCKEKCAPAKKEEPKRLAKAAVASKKAEKADAKKVAAKAEDKPAPKAKSKAKAKKDK